MVELSASIVELVARLRRRSIGNGMILANPDGPEAANTIMDLLVRLYRFDPVETARLCDEELDRSGKLLGEVREMARAA